MADVGKKDGKMLAIVNVSPEGTPQTGPNQYEVRINSWVIATFEHNRRPGGAAQCLRDAADAADRRRADALVAAIGELMKR